VTDLQRSVDFYTSKLGFQLGWSTPSGSSALLIYDDEGTRWMLGLFQVDTVVHRSPAEYHISFRVAEAQADTMVAWLRAREIEPFHPPHAPIQRAVDEPIVHGWMPAAAVFFKRPRWAYTRTNRRLKRSATPGLLIPALERVAGAR